MQSRIASCSADKKKDFFLYSLLKGINDFCLLKRTEDTVCHDVTSVTDLRSTDYFISNPKTSDFCVTNTPSPKLDVSDMIPMPPIIKYTLPNSKIDGDAESLKTKSSSSP